MIEPDVAPITVAGLRAAIALCGLALLAVALWPRRAAQHGPSGWARGWAAVFAVGLVLIAVAPLEAG